jgi:hypothetical protein
VRDDPQETKKDEGSNGMRINSHAGSHVLENLRGDMNVSRALETAREKEHQNFLQR